MKGKSHLSLVFQRKFSYLPGGLSILSYKPDTVRPELHSQHNNEYFSSRYGKTEEKILLILNNHNFLAQLHDVAFLIHALGLPKQLF